MITDQIDNSVLMIFIKDLYVQSAFPLPWKYMSLTYGRIYLKRVSKET